MTNREGEVWMDCRTPHAQHHREPILIVRTYLPEGHPERLLRHDCVGLWDGWRFGAEELVLKLPGWERIA